MKNIFFMFLQFILFVFVFAAGSFFPPFHIEHIISQTPAATRVFVCDGVLLMIGLFVLILVIEVARKRIASAGIWTTVALIFAAAIGFIAKFGFLTR
jgi:hypothetical protein